MSLEFTTFNPYLPEEITLPKLEELSTYNYKRDHTAEEKAEIKEMKKTGITPPGHKKREKGPKPKSRLHEQDFLLFDFLLAVEFATDEQVAIALGVAKNSAYQRLRSLQVTGKSTPDGPGLVGSTQPSGTRQLWFLQRKVIKILENRDPFFDHKKYKWVNKNNLTDSRPYHTLCVNQIAAHLLGGTGVFFKSSKRITTDNLISEAKIVTAFQRKVHHYDSKSDLHQVYKWEKAAALKAIKNGEITMDKLAENFPALWTASGERSIHPDKDASTAHTPDLVLSFESIRVRGGLSVAFELERTAKSAGEYDKIHRAYLAEKIMYAKIVWVYTDERIAKMLKDSAARVGLTEERISFVPMVAGKNSVFEGPASL